VLTAYCPLHTATGIAVPYLIDGYNLLFAYLGAPPSRSLSKALERGRKRLLEKLRAGHGDGASAVTVIFDAAGAPPGVSAEQDYHGIHVTFAVHEERADDLIENLIRRESAPRRLTVVTDDHHIQQAAHRRHCTVMGCTAYLEWLEHHKDARPPNAPRTSTKPETMTAEEAQRWLGEFADLENDPNLKKLSDPHGPS
jgi:predicted RNA-binding protein with PIN domain